MCFIRFLKKFCPSIWNDKKEIIEHIERVEEHYKDIKTDLENIQKSIDPISRLILDMESKRMWHKKEKK